MGAKNCCIFQLPSDMHFMKKPKPTTKDAAGFSEMPTASVPPSPPPPKSPASKPNPTMSRAEAAKAKRMEAAIEQECHQYKRIDAANQEASKDQPKPGPSGQGGTLTVDEVWNELQQWRHSVQSREEKEEARGKKENTNGMSKEIK